jgi:hypothetical protein
MAGMEDAWVRVRRAETNAKRLKDEVAKLRRPYPDVEMRPKDEHGEVHALIVARVPERPPKEWGLLIGDILIDLRSALDYAVYALAVAHTGLETPPYDYRLEFPICKNDPLAWGQALGRHKLDGLPQKAIDYIGSIQANKPGNGGDNTPLLFLEELVGLNKHRFIPVSWSRLDSTNLEIRCEGCRPDRAKAFHLPGELKDGSVLVDLVLADLMQNVKVQVKLKVSTFVVIAPVRGDGWIKLAELGKQVRGSNTSSENWSSSSLRVMRHPRPVPRST